MAANNKQNVSTVRGHKGGYLFSAPVGTAGAPTKQNYLPSLWLSGGNPPEGWECLGYIPEDGFTETVDMESGDPIRDLNLDDLDETEGAVTESLTVALMEIKAHSLGTVYGHANVTDANGTLEVAHNWGKAGEHYQYVFLLLLKNDRAWTKYIPDAKVSSIGDITHNKTTAAQHEITLKYLTDESGSGCYDWIQSTETPAPKLSTLSLSSLTLSPSFSADKVAYTSSAGSSVTSTTVTASAGSGNTVQIKSGENTYSSGGSVPIVAGTNKIEVIVTNTASGAKSVYTITVTKS